MDWELVREVVEKWVRQSAERVVHRHPEVMFCFSRTYVNEQMPLVVGAAFDRRDVQSKPRGAEGQRGVGRVLYQLCVMQEEGPMRRVRVHGELCDRLTLVTYYTGPECSREAACDPMAVLGTAASVIKELDKKVEEVLQRELLQEVR